MQNKPNILEMKELGLEKDKLLEKKAGKNGDGKHKPLVLNTSEAKTFVELPPTF